MSTKHFKHVCQHSNTGTGCRPLPGDIFHIDPHKRWEEYCMATETTATMA